MRSECTRGGGAGDALKGLLRETAVVLHIRRVGEEFDLFRPKMLIEATAGWCPHVDSLTSVRLPAVEVVSPSCLRTELRLTRPEDLNIFPDCSADSVICMDQLTLMDKAAGSRLLSNLNRIARKQVIVSVGGGSCGAAEMSSSSTSMWEATDFGPDWRTIVRQELQSGGGAGAGVLYAIKDTDLNPGQLLAFGKKTLVMSSFALPIGIDEVPDDEERAIRAFLFSALSFIEPATFMLSGRWGFSPYVTHTLYDPATLATHRHPSEYLNLPGALNQSVEVIEGFKFLTISSLRDIPSPIIHLAEHFRKNEFDPRGLNSYIYLDRPNIGAFALIYLKEKYGFPVTILDVSAGRLPAGALFAKHALPVDLASPGADPMAFARRMTSL